MLLRPFKWILLLSGLALVAGCDRLPGRPTKEDRWKPPEAVKDFTELFDTNCRACHGNGKTIGGSMPMNNPLYLAIVPKEVVKKVVASGIPGTPMPGFSHEAGGLLTDEQIGILADGIYAWAKGHEIPADTLPPYSAALGNAEHGKEVYTAACANCHGPEGQGVNDKAGSVVDPAFLALVTDQYLRTVVIAGRPDLDMPDFQSYVHGKPLKPDEIADLVAWLASHRKGPAPGEPAKTADSNAGAQPQPQTSN